MGKQVELLEHHADVRTQPRQFLALCGQCLAVDVDRAFLDGFEAVNRPTQGGLSGPRRPQHHNHLSAGNL